MLKRKREPEVFLPIKKRKRVLGDLWIHKWMHEPLQFKMDEIKNILIVHKYGKKKEMC